VSARIRDWFLFSAALGMVALAFFSALEDSWPGFIAGLATALAIVVLLWAREEEG
jgi:hypothetical protein